MCRPALHCATGRRIIRSMATHRVARPRTVLVAAAIAAMTGCYSGQPVDQLLTGDEALLEVARGEFTDAYDRVAMAVIDGDEVRTAFVSADESTTFELGTATKALTGLLLADAIERGEVALDDRVGSRFELGDADAAALTLRDLATHHSGLPQSPLAPGALDPVASRDDPSEQPDLGGLRELIDRVALTPTIDGLEHHYSDFDAALVGQSVADAAGIRFGDLLEERILTPLGMADATVVESGDLLPERLAQGHDEFGRRMGSRGAGAYAPAVGVAATVDDVVALAEAVLDGSTPGAAALEPIADTRWPRTQTGYFWEVESREGGEVTYILGWSQGFASAVLVDRRAGIAAVLLSNVRDDWPWNEANAILDVVRE